MTIFFPLSLCWVDVESIIYYIYVAMLLLFQEELRELGMVDSFPMSVQSSNSEKTKSSVDLVL